MKPFILTVSFGRRNRTAVCYSIAQAAGYIARFAASVGQSAHGIAWNTRPLTAV
jgi:hypothetical protein